MAAHGSSGSNFVSGLDAEEQFSHLFGNFLIYEYIKLTISSDEAGNHVNAEYFGDHIFISVETGRPLPRDEYVGRAMMTKAPTSVEFYKRIPASVFLLDSTGIF